MKRSIFALACAAALVSCRTTSVSLPQQDYSYRTIDMQEHTDCIETRISYPQFDALPELSAQIEQYARSQYAPLRAEAQEFRQHAGDSAVRYEYTQSFTADEDGSFISVLLKTETYSGGAHGSTELKSFVWNTQAGALQDIEQASGLSYGQIAQYCRTELKQRGVQGDEQWLLDGTQADAEHFGTFTISKGLLTVYFAQYQVAPYSAGILSVEIGLH